jgi:hypothetical protein
LPYWPALILFSVSSASRSKGLFWLLPYFLHSSGSEFPYADAELSRTQ